MIIKECKSSNLKELVGKVLENNLTEDMTKKCKHIFLLKNATIKKVKSITRLYRVDMTQLNAIQGDSEIVGVKLEKGKTIKNKK